MGVWQSLHQQRDGGSLAVIHPTTITTTNNAAAVGCVAHYRKLALSCHYAPWVAQKALMLYKRPSAMWMLDDHLMTTRQSGTAQ